MWRLGVYLRSERCLEQESPRKLPATSMASERARIGAAKPRRNREMHDGRHRNQPAFKTVVRRRLRRRGWVRFPCASAIRLQGLFGVLVVGAAKKMDIRNF